MSFSPRRALAISWKDSVDLLKNRGLLWSLGALPAVVVATPVAIIWAYAGDPTDPSLRLMAQYYGFPGGGAGAARFLIDKVLADWFSLFLIMPVFVPILISSHAVAGEKERRTLEPLLASPVTPVELVVGKSLAALLPALAITFVSFVALCVGVDAVAWRVSRALVLPNAPWLFGVFVVAPLFAFFGNGIAVVLSARVSDARLAQQLAGLFVLPLVGLAAAQLGGFLRSGGVAYAVMAGVVLVLDGLLLVAAMRLVDRERLMSRWGP